MVKAILDWLLWKRKWVLTGLIQKPEFTDKYEDLREDATDNPCDMFNIYSCAKATDHLKGEIAEVGVYKGGSAKMICRATKKKVHLFDTFEGIPSVSEYDKKQMGGHFQVGDFNSGTGVMRQFLNENCKIYKGIFPQDTSKWIEKKRFSFVHLDVDVYKSTKESLEFFYPRMVKGGIILSHDYPNSLGVKKAFDEFFKDKEEYIIELLDKQGMVVKNN